MLVGTEEPCPLSQCDVTVTVMMLLSRQQNSTNKLIRDFLHQILFLYSRTERLFSPGIKKGKFGEFAKTSPKVRAVF